MPSSSRFARVVRRTSAFTLTELLVVIVIVALLAAVSLPVFFNVRESSRATACLSNMRQLALGLQMYADDSDGYFPTQNIEAPSAANVENWDTQIVRYVKSKNAFQCPDLQIPSTFVPAPNMIAIGYALNIEISGAYNGNHLLKTVDAAVQFPSNTVTVCEAGFVQQNKDVGIATETDGPNGVSDLEPGQHFQGLPGGLRHHGGSNYGFADGHAHWYRPEQVAPGANANGDKIPNNGASPSFAL